MNERTLVDFKDPKGVRVRAEMLTRAPVLALQVGPRATRPAWLERARVEELRDACDEFLELLDEEAAG